MIMIYKLGTRIGEGRGLLENDLFRLCLYNYMSNIRFLILQPKLDVLILGVGSQKDVDVVRKNVVPTLNKHRIGHEIMNTVKSI